MYAPSVETVRSMPLNGFAKFSPAWLNNPKRADMGHVEPHFDPCVICDHEPGLPGSLSSR
jgi:hypothetical protein